MSYIRFGQDASDVYVYHSTSGRFVCCGCPRLLTEMGSLAEFETREQLIEHLERDRNEGYHVPESVFDRLRKEISDAANR